MAISVVFFVMVIIIIMMMMMMMMMNLIQVSTIFNAGVLPGDTVPKSNQTTHIKFEERGKTGVPGEKPLSVQSREPTNSTHV